MARPVTRPEDRPATRPEGRAATRPATRESNMELLRIVAMAMIVVFHASYKSGFEFEALTVNTFGIKMLWMLGETGVKLFMMVSGYFLVLGRLRAAKLVSLVAEVGFYAALGVIASAIVTDSGGVTHPSLPSCECSCPAIGSSSTTLSSTR